MTSFDEEESAELERQTHEYARELRETAASLRGGAERWRHDPATVGELAERLGAQWIDPTFEYALPHAKVVVELADRLEEIADELD